LSDWKRKVTAEYVPTADQRALVESASAFGITQAEIATQLKISEPTLRKYFREELNGGAFKANMKVGGNMYGLTQSVVGEETRERNPLVCRLFDTLGLSPRCPRRHQPGSKQGRELLEKPA
jgi:hypothetical protein